MEETRNDMTHFVYDEGSDVMITPDEVGAIKKLYELGWGARRIARNLGMSRNTVKKHLKIDGYPEYKKPTRPKALEPYREWVEAEYKKHRGNAEVVRQELQSQKGITVSLRTVERSVEAQKRLFEAEAKATLRFETEPGEQAQVDFGTRKVLVGSEELQIHLFVMTLGFSRRLYVEAFPDETRSSWQAGIERGFLHFGGVTRELLIDNPKALVKSHNAATREVVFMEPFLEFARYWAFMPRACAPYRARTKGKDENGVGYVKRNAIAGREFTSWSALEAHLAWWMREIADKRIHGTTEERPIDRFVREQGALKSIGGRSPYVQAREFIRKVHSDLCIEVDRNSYSVPWKYIGNEVTVRIANRQVIISYSGKEIARHQESFGRRERCIDRDHLKGVSALHLEKPREGELVRPLGEYEAAIGGAQ
jgi:transposase